MENAITKSDLKAALAEFRGETKSDMDSLRDELTATMRQIETNLLTEFDRYAKGQQARMHHLETSDADLILRLASIEDRLLALESRRPPTV